MTQSGKSLLVFGIYLIFTGVLFILIPQTLISAAFLPPIPAGWARFIGLLILVIAAYDSFCGYNNIQPVIKISVYVRLGFAVGTILLYAFGQMPVSIVLLGGVDALAAFWTMMALRSEASKS